LEEEKTALEDFQCSKWIKNTVKVKFYLPHEEHEEQLVGELENKQSNLLRPNLARADSYGGGGGR
jgi:hypothetical protein